MRVNKKVNILRIAKALIEAGQEGFPSISEFARYLNMDKMTVYNTLQFLRIYVDFKSQQPEGIPLPNMPTQIKIKEGTTLEVVNRFIAVKESLKSIKEEGE
jgi:hypothetical protein